MKIISIFFAIIVLISGGCTSVRNFPYEMDTAYASISYPDFCTALEKVHTKMLADGWTEYRFNALDCEDYALKMAIELRKQLVDDLSVDCQGIPVGVCGYVTNAGGKHAIVFADIGVNRYYFEPFPMKKWLQPITLTSQEERSSKLLY